MPLRILAVIAVVSLVACHSASQQPATTTALRQALSGSPRASKAIWADVQSFYERRGGLAWVSEHGQVRQGSAILALLDRARSHGLNPDDYHRSDLQNSIAAAARFHGSEPERASALADLDTQITIALLTLGRDVALGRTTPAELDVRWKARRTPPDLAGTLDDAMANSLPAWLDQICPQHPEYKQLLEALSALEGQQNKGGWPAITAKALAPRQTSPAVVVLRQRLAASGQLTDSNDGASPLYDDKVRAAVKSFQEHHTLKPTGIADAHTIAAMNVPIEQRITQVALNLERWRWMPDDFGTRHLIVNIPSYHVIAREHGDPVLDIRVVVGKPGHETPVFSGDMTTIVFSPYWNIPDTIAEGETVPSLIRDKQYLERNGIEVLRRTKKGTEVVDPSHIKWDDEDATKGLLFRQKPGAHNALGRVKFLFPNQYDVYLHDTPADSLFSRTGRAFSHGCVRVEEPEKLAQYVLRDDPSWDDEKIGAAMNAGVEQAVKLPTSIPVHLVYFTAAVDKNGGLHLFDDVYGYDAKQARR